MFKIPLSELRTKIISASGIEAEELDSKIKNKINELSGLISEEGAAHIIANELGINLVKEASSKLKIKEIYAGMKNVTTVGKVVQKYPMREFAKGDSKGKVCSVIIGDETGTIRVVFWNEQVDLVDKLNEEDIVSVNDSYARENRNDREIHLGQNGSIVINPEGEQISLVRKSPNFEGSSSSGSSGNFIRKSISSLSAEDEMVEVVGTIVQVFDPRFFTRKDKPDETSYVLNAVLDDGTGTIRAVFWQNQTNHLLEKEQDHIINYKDNMALFEDVKTDLLGEQLKVKGRIKKNEMFSRIEFHVQVVERANPEQELARLG
ncbi:MAG TPA: OB-fold nucleic acid binding domain-containing protein [Candidatus Nanoarchaeia archaeon]|nr:OB-fold nucleic acid binding domain-containing protein [Candidatus Nanoarchaeia archaeon]